MIKIILVDDELDARINLINLLSFHFPDVKILGEFESPRKALSFLQKEDVDLLFLDIEMPEMNGFELLEQLTLKNMQLIFTTAHSDYASKAFRTNAVDYLLKPISVSDLREALNRVRLRTNNEVASHFSSVKNLIEEMNNGNKPIPLKIPSTEGFKVVDSNKIILVSAEGAYSRVHIEGNQEELVSKNLGYFETILSSSLFIRVHHSKLINLNYLVEFSNINGGTAILQGGHRIIISRRKLKAFKEVVDVLYL